MAARRRYRFPWVSRRTATAERRLAYADGYEQGLRDAYGWGEGSKEAATLSEALAQGSVVHPLARKP